MSKVGRGTCCETGETRSPLLRLLRLQPDAGKQTPAERPAPGINNRIYRFLHSADATPDQIDQIFASMAKHIYPRD